MALDPFPETTLRIAAAYLHRADGRTLLVRKRGTTAFMQPGGKIEPGETPLHALIRELREELNFTFAPATALHVGQFSSPAAHEPGYWVTADLFRIRTAAEFLPAAEIEEIIWIDPMAPGELELAPLTRDHVLPVCGGYIHHSTTPSIPARGSGGTVPGSVPI
jgi:8-oxo-dGTP pyrophosphatase MutT (NUDIX family)